MALLEKELADRICIYSRSEYAQALMRQNIKDPDARLRWFIGDEEFAAFPEATQQALLTSGVYTADTTTRRKVSTVVIATEDAPPAAG